MRACTRDKAGGRERNGRIAQGFRGPIVRLLPLPVPRQPVILPFRLRPGPRFGFSGKARRQVPALPLCRRACVRASERHMVILYTPFRNRVFPSECLRNCRFLRRASLSVAPSLSRLLPSSQKRQNFVLFGFLERYELSRYTRNFMIDIIRF